MFLFSLLVIEMNKCLRC